MWGRVGGLMSSSWTVFIPQLWRGWEATAKFYRRWLANTLLSSCKWKRWALCCTCTSFLWWYKIIWVLVTCWLPVLRALLNRSYLWIYLWFVQAWECCRGPTRSFESLCFEPLPQILASAHTLGWRKERDGRKLCLDTCTSGRCW